MNNEQKVADEIQKIFENEWKSGIFEVKSFLCGGSFKYKLSHKP